MPTASRPGLRRRWPFLLFALLVGGCDDGPPLPSIAPATLARLVPGRTSLADADRLLGAPESEARYHAGPGANFILNHPVSVDIGASPDGWRGCLVRIGGGGRQECRPGAAVPPGFTLDTVSRHYRFRARATEGPDAGRPVELSVAARFGATGLLDRVQVGTTRIRTLWDRITEPRLW